MRPNTSRAAFVFSILLLLPAVVTGQSLPGVATGAKKTLASSIGKTYGGASLSSVSLSSAGFSPWQPSNTWGREGAWGGLYFTSATGIALASASVPLPVGASVEALELIACDASVDAELIFYMYGFSGTGGIESPETFTTGLEAQDGCKTYTGTFATPIEIQTDATYQASVAFGPDTLTTMHGLRVLYRLKVSPSPAVATFGDVPIGSGLNKFVEALYAAGITGGCGGGNFCPNATLTRGQMAVFLATALGLHFPN
jgi:hypothetical protein